MTINSGSTVFLICSSHLEMYHCSIVGCLKHPREGKKNGWLETNNPICMLECFRTCPSSTPSRYRATTCRRLGPMPCWSLRSPSLMASSTSEQVVLYLFINFYCEVILLLERSSRSIVKQVMITYNTNQSHLTLSFVEVWKNM